MSTARNRDELTVDLAANLHLHLATYSQGRRINGSVYFGKRAIDGQIVFFSCDREAVRIGPNNSLWFDGTNVELPWASFLKVADFLLLDIPQPKLPAGQEVPR